MGGCARALCLHINMLLAVYSGAALATGARLLWDPSTYVAPRELFPREYALAAALLPAAAAAQLALAHAALAALTAPLRRRARAALLCSYAVLTLALVCGEAAGAWLLARAVRRWLRSNEALALFNALEMREHVDYMLNYFGRLYPFVRKVRTLIEEAEKKLPINAYVGAAACVLFVTLQLMAALSALAAARGPSPAAPARERARPAAFAPHYRPISNDNSDNADSSKEALKTAYRGGRLVIVRQ